MSGSVTISVAEHAGIPRLCEPVTIGLPFPRALVRDPSQLSLVDSRGRPLPLQAAVLNRWPDGSVKWGLFDFQVDLEADAVREYAIRIDHPAETPADHPTVTVDESPGGFRVDTGTARIVLDKTSLIPRWVAPHDGSALLDPEASRCALVAASGREYCPHIRAISVETSGPLTATFRLDGSFAAGPDVFCQFFAFLSFFAGSALMRLTLTVRNPRRARHPRNLWDLGDRGSLSIRDFSLQVGLMETGHRIVTWSTAPGAPVQTASNQDLAIYQDSSGGVNWNSRNHVDRFQNVTTSFRGYRLRCGEVRSEGERAQPLVALSIGTRGVAGAVRDFWQNFPKAIETRDRALIIRLFPLHSSTPHELQGGEQKTHVVYLAPFQASDDRGHLAWVRAPLVPRAAPEWYAASRAIPYLTPKATDANHDYLALVDSAISGEESFERKREVIDEYGWRHWGDIYADHEAIYYTGPPPVISHYNNQYDAIQGAFIHYLRSGDVRWFHMMDHLASHVIDIDVYHTTEDRRAYSGGPFWHTAHYTSAFTATHRSYSRWAGRGGGGPSNEHCYTTGLLHHYFLTGNVESRQTVLDLARWIVDIDDGGHHVLGWLDRGPTGAATSTASRAYHGPGRGAGNAIGTLLNASILSGERGFIEKADAFIRRCIHPRDDIEAWDLLDAERRWSYTVFLQTLGRYLDLKIERGELDTRYAYAQESLLHYARWMARHERPYLTCPEGLEYPTETWAAQDMRKSDVFTVAAKHARGVERACFLERSAHFFRSSVDALTGAKTKTLARPVVLMMTCGYMRAHFQSHPDDSAPLAPSGVDFGRPQRFVPQRTRALRTAARLGALAATAALALAYRTWRG